MYKNTHFKLLIVILFAMVANIGNISKVVGQNPLHCVPDLALSITPNPVCIGDLVIFDIYGTEGCMYDVVWNYDGFLQASTALGTNNTNTEWYYMPTQSGTYNISLILAYDTVISGVLTQFHRSDSITVQLIVRDSFPEFEAPNKICLGDTAFFQDLSLCPVATSWNWNFGDGTSSTLQNPSHIYMQTGNYTVTLQTFPGGKTKSKTIEVILPEKPIIKGYKNNCDDIVNYTIENLDSNYTYTWSTQVFNQSTNQYTIGQFTINGSSNVVAANTASIDWTTATFPSLPSYAIINVEATMINGNCSAVSTYKVYPCCSSKNYNILHDTIISSDMTFTNTNDLIINGTVIFSGGVTFDNSSILMGPLAKIIVDNGHKFESINSSFLAKQCLIMNDGIYAETINDSIVFISNSQLSSSINGLYSSNGAYLKANNSLFGNNLVGISIVNHKSQSYPLPPPPFTSGTYIITNCEFGISQYNPLVLTYPYNYQQPLTGIRISNVEGVNIGSNTQGGNTFSRLRNGIIIFNSKVGIYNNTFKNIENQMGPAPVHEAAISINSSSIFNMDNIGDITIGASGNYHNEFDSCEQSIYSNNSKLSVNNNVFKYGHQSIFIYNFQNGTNIHYNKFKDVYNGIKVHNLLGMNRKLNVDNNYFGGHYDNSPTLITREAISLINCNSQANSSNRTQVANNTIKYAGQKNFLTSGIRVQNCEGIMVSSNFISRNTSFSNINNDWNKTIGIRVATSQGATITDNYVFGFGKSIETYGNLNLTQFSCNELKIFKYGFYWGANTTLSNQGRLSTPQIPGINNHNEWYTSAAINNNSKLANITASTNNIIDTNNIYWYYNSSFGANWTPNSVGNPYIIISIPNNNSPHQCVGGSGPNGSGTGTGNNNGGTNVMELIKSIEDDKMRDLMFENLMEGMHYTDLQNEYRAYDADFLYKMLRVDTNMMWLGGGKDADYRRFFDSVKVANTGKFAEVYYLIEKGDFTKAEAVNNAIVPEQNIFANMKTVLGIYLNTWCKEKYTLSNSNYETLYNIANQTPYKGGDAVYTARIMLGFEPDEHGLAYRMHNVEKEVENNALVLYPNPASNELTIEFENKEFENVHAILKVYSIAGKLIYQTQFNTNNSFKILSVEDLKNGLYIYHVSLSNGIDKSGKLVILKQ